MIRLADIRSYAMALPEVVEKATLPAARLPGRGQAPRSSGEGRRACDRVCRAGGGQDGGRRSAGRLRGGVANGRIFVGLRVDLAKVTKKRMQELIEHAWRNRAPKRLVAEYDSR
jgi:hypothetical protein